MACPQCFSGHKHEGQTLGKEEKIHGVDTYVTEGENPKAIIVFIPDAFGWKFNNSRILADHYASRVPARVYLPEFMEGVPIPEWTLSVFPNLLDTSSLRAWLLKPYYIALMLYGAIPFFYYNLPGASFPRVKKFMTALRESQDPAEKDRPIGAAGFCWGGKHITLLAGKDGVTSTGKPLVDAVFTGHPSLLTLPGDIENVEKPYSVAIGDKDTVLRMKGVEQVKEILGKKSAPWEVKVYEGAGHGFCVRADPTGVKTMEHSIASEEQAVKWYQAHLK